jgi:hypothetical protein
MSSRLLTVVFTMLFTGTLIAAVRAENTEERPVAAAEMAVLYGGGYSVNRCCGAFTLCDAQYQLTQCANRGRNEDCSGVDLPFGHNKSCYVTSEGNNCIDTEFMLCLVRKDCERDYMTGACKERSGSQQDIMNNGNCADDCQ